MSDPTLLTRNVFLDTEAFIHQNLRFDHSTLKRLKELGEGDKLHLYTSEVVVEEVRRKILEGVVESHKALKRFSKTASMLEHYAPEEIRCLFADIKEEQLTKLGEQIWKEYIEMSNIEVISAKETDVQQLLDLYFTGKPPFSLKKKNEFPDAISLLSLSNWQEKTDENIYVVSGDGDYKAWCNGKSEYYYVETLNEFMDLYNRAEEKLTEEIHELVEVEKYQILKTLSDSFLWCGFEYAPNWEAEVENVEVINIELIDVSVIDIADESVFLNLTLEIEYSADVSGPDYDSGIWDSENKEYAYVPVFHETISNKDWYDVSLEMSVSLKEKKITDIDNVLFNDSRNIIIDVDDGFLFK